VFKVYNLHVSPIHPPLGDFQWAIGPLQYTNPVRMVPCCARLTMVRCAPDRYRARSGAHVESAVLAHSTPTTIWVIGGYKYPQPAHSKQHLSCIQIRASADPIDSSLRDLAPYAFERFLVLLF
jgi:hypothetical protein